jgi:hypothetical protein
LIQYQESINKGETISIMIKNPVWYFILLIGAFGCTAFLLTTVAMAGKDSPGQSVPLQGNHHIQSPGSPHIPYNSDPPTSGPHVPFIVRWGIHKVSIPREIQVHNLEDGGVIIQYNCTNCSELVSKLEAIVQQYQKKAEIERSKTGSKHPSRYEHLILAPYPGMDAIIALTAWGKLDKFSGFDEARITRFIEAYIGIDHHPAKEE